MYHKYKCQCKACCSRRLGDIDKIIGDIHQMMKTPNFKPQTSGQMKDRADRLQHMATTLKLQGREVADEYR